MVIETTQTAESLQGVSQEDWGDALLQAGITETVWQQAGFAAGIGRNGWQESAGVSGTANNHWQSALHADTEGGNRWQDAFGERFATGNRWQDALHLNVNGPDAWEQAGWAVTGFSDRAGDGLRIDTVNLEVWQQAGYPANARNPGVEPPPPQSPPTRNIALNLRSALQYQPLALNLGYDWPAWDVTDRRYFGVLNTCSVVRLPDRTELPVTAVSVETDCDSWAWSVSLALAGPDAWALCQPAPMPVEVEISINDHLWTALLDDPQLTRGFNNSRIAAKGLSRSAWLTAPWTPATTVAHSAPITAQQVAEAALDNTAMAVSGGQLPANWDTD